MTSKYQISIVSSLVSLLTVVSLISCNNGNQTSTEASQASAPVEQASKSESASTSADTVISAETATIEKISPDTPEKKVVPPTYDFSSVKIGDRFNGGVVIKKKKNEVLLVSPSPLGSGGWDDAQKLVRKCKLGGHKWRLPSPAELELVFSMRNLLDSYEQNWYWTNNTKGNLAEHIGIYRGDHALVPKEHGKFVFAVTTLKN
jgi:hypothetical protein